MGPLENIISGSYLFSPQRILQRYMCWVNDDPNSCGMLLASKGMATNYRLLRTEASIKLSHILLLYYSAVSPHWFLFTSFTELSSWVMLLMFLGNYLTLKFCFNKKTSKWDTCANLRHYYAHFTSIRSTKMLTKVNYRQVRFKSWLLVLRSF